MIDIVVSRGTGLKSGDPFISPLISDPVIAELKGEALLDEHAVPHSSLVIEVPYMSGVVLGQTLRVNEGVNGLVWVGKVIALNHKVSEGAFTTELTLDKVDAS